MSHPVPPADSRCGGVLSPKPLNVISPFRTRLTRCAFRGLERIVDRSTTGANWMDEVETGWTEQHNRGVGPTPETETTTLPR
jgi:hypothetical protein